MELIIAADLTKGTFIVNTHKKPPAQLPEDYARQVRALIEARQPAPSQPLPVAMVPPEPIPVAVAHTPGILTYEEYKADRRLAYRAGLLTKREIKQQEKVHGWTW